MPFVERSEFAPFVRIWASSIARIAITAALAALLADCSASGKLPGPFNCTEDGAGGYCELGNGAYLGFRLGMTKEAAFSNLCDGGHGRVITTTDFYHSREDLVGYEFASDRDRVVCSTPKARGYDYWTLESVGALPGQDSCTKVGTRYVYMDFQDARLARVATTCEPASPGETVFHPDNGAPSTPPPSSSANPILSHSGPAATH
jgi:hypothetical protein